MRNLYKLIFILLLVTILRTQTATAQEQGEWPPPARLSSSEGSASEAFLATDQYGYLHVFWIELLENERSIIQYARYNGVTWSITINLHVTKPYVPIGNVSPVVDQSGTLHIIWSEGENGPVYYSYAPAHDALSATHWQPRKRIKIPATWAELKIDSNGVFHILYTQNMGNEGGFYYIRSDNQGESWTEPLWLDPDIPPDYVPAWYKFELDEAGGLHAVWDYMANDGTGGNWVRYAHSLDGGNTWSSPFTIDRVSESNSDKQLDAAKPVMAVQGRTIHVIWAGGKLHYRNHRISEDAGQTWGQPRRVFGELNGQAGDGMVVDGAGRVHFFSQIRYPQGIYHAIWEGDHWTKPSLVYLISYGPGDPFGDHIHAHRTIPAIRAGNQLILTLTDPPPETGRRLFFTQRILDDLPPATVEPTPTPTVLPTEQVEATPVPLGTISSPPRDLGALAPIDVPRPDAALWIGLLPPLLLLVSIILFRILIKLRH